MASTPSTRRQLDGMTHCLICAQVSRPAVLFLCAVLVLLTAVAFRFVARKHFDGFETKPVQTEEDPAEELQAVENVLLRG